MSQTPEIPLIFRGDAHYIVVERESDTRIRILYIDRFDANESVRATRLRFFDLDEEARVAVRTQVSRKYPGCTIYV